MKNVFENLAFFDFCLYFELELAMHQVTLVYGLGEGFWFLSATLLVQLGVWSGENAMETVFGNLGFFEVLLEGI